jgi:hypothetical protein
LTVITWLQLVELPQLSVANQDRLMTLLHEEPSLL